MKSSQLKTIAILILLALNISLLTITAARSWERERLDSQTAREFSAVLESHGVTLGDFILSDPPAYASIYETVVEAAFRAKASAALIGRAEAIDQGGGIYIFETGNGIVRFRGGGYLNVLMSQNYRIALPDGMAYGQHAAGLMSEMGFDTAGAEIYEEPGPDGGTMVTFRDRFDGKSVFNCSMVFLYDGKGLYAAEGRWLPPDGELVPLSQSAANSPESVLLPFVTSEKEAGSSMTEIFSMEPGYVILPAAPGVVHLTPVWLIKTDAGDSYINIVTGSKEFPETVA